MTTVVSIVSFNVRDLSLEADFSSFEGLGEYNTIVSKAPAP